MENNEVNYTIALLIDADNISYKYINYLLTKLNSFGRVTIKRIYGDFSDQQKSPWKETATQLGLKPVQQYTYNSGKNNADSALIIEAMDILHSHGVNAFCLATSDSDFTSLSMRLKEDNMFIIGAGEDKTPNSFITTCDRFIILGEQNDVNKKASKNTKNTKKSPTKKQALPLVKAIGLTINEIISTRQENDEFVKFSTVMADLYKTYPQFDSNQYNFKNKKDFCESLGFIVKKDSTGALVINKPPYEG